MSFGKNFGGAFQTLAERYAPTDDGEWHDDGRQIPHTMLLLNDACLRAQVIGIFSRAFLLRDL